MRSTPACWNVHCATARQNALLALGSLWLSRPSAGVTTEARKAASLNRKVEPAKVMRALLRAVTATTRDVCAPALSG